MIQSNTLINMFSKTDLFSLLRLYASNKTLLEIYYSLYSKLEGEDGEQQREELNSRIAMRERFRLELMLCIEENFIEKEDSFIDKVSIFSFPFLTQLETAIPSSLMPDTWEKCYDHEVTNLHKYYNTLSSPSLSRKISDLLMDQKNGIEHYLHCYV